MLHANVRFFQQPVDERAAVTAFQDRHYNICNAMIENRGSAAPGTRIGSV